MKLPTTPGVALLRSRYGVPALVFGSIALAVTIVACVNAPDIDGPSIAKIGSPAAPPACPDVCRRLSLLCGYAPDDCISSCDAEYDALHRTCVGAAASCQEALETCANEEEADGGEDDAGDEDAAGEDDAATDPDASDASDPDAGGDADANDGDGGDGG